jgi:hypothetical protein
MRALDEDIPMIDMKRIFFTLAVSLSSLLLGQATAQAASLAGQVIVASGEFVAIATDGTARPLKRKSEFYSGETLKTGVDGRAQIKFIDEALMSLRSNTEFRVDEYRYDPGNKENSRSGTTLSKGGLRTLTGQIAKQIPSAYKITTPVATIGVRGTDLALLLNDEGMDIAFWDGQGYSSNQAGKFDLGKDVECQFAQIKDIKTPPVCHTDAASDFQEGLPDEGPGDTVPEDALFSDAVNDSNENGVGDVEEDILNNIND